MNRPLVKLRLDLSVFDERPFAHALQTADRSGIGFSTFAELGDTNENRGHLYELNKTCSADIPARGEFYDFPDYVRNRIEHPAHNPSGVIIARHGSNWVGMAAVSDWRTKGFVFSEMTGVLKPYRRQGISLAMKLLTLRFAKRCDVRWVLTMHDAENVAPIQLNRRLGFEDFDWSMEIFQ